MTQKELLYVEDAVNHEQSIIKICEETRNMLEDQKLIDLIDSQIQSHQETKENLIQLLEEKVNE